MVRVSLIILLLIGWTPVSIGSPGDTIRVEGMDYRDGKGIEVFVCDGIIVKTRSVPVASGEGMPYIAPGLIDMQINGFEGIDFADQNLTMEKIRKATHGIWRTGTTTFLPTVITGQKDSLKRSFQLLAAAPDDPEIGNSVPGFHLEGPYISPKPGFRGAHPERFIRPPDWEEFLTLQAASQGKIKLITLAPETHGAIPFIEKCRSSGVLVSLGHHDASSDTIHLAAAAGATLSTHLGNGCANMINRHNNPLWPQLADDRLTATLIADGFHLTQDEMISFYRIKGADRTILVSDALDLAGLPPGEYVRGGRTVVMTGEVIKYPAENVLAGAASPLSAGVSNMIKLTGCSLADAIRIASTNPARMLGLNNVGEIKPGYRADVILFTFDKGTMVIQKTLVAGKTVYEAPNP